MQLDVVNNANKKVGAIEVRDDVFGGRVNADLIWESVVHANAAERRGTHATKNRVLVDVAVDDKLSRSVRNVRGVSLVASGRLTAREVADASRVVVTKGAIEKLQEALG